MINNYITRELDQLILDSLCDVVITEVKKDPKILDLSFFIIVDSALILSCNLKFSSSIF